MQAKSAAEVNELIATPEFVRWAAELDAATTAEIKAAESFDEFLTQSTLLDFRAELAQKNAIDTLYRAGECEDAAARLVAEATDIENRSFEVVATFEEQRLKVSEIWYRLGAQEKAVAELRDRVNSAREQKAVAESAKKQAEGAHRDGDMAKHAAEANRREAEATEIETLLRKQEREHRQIHADYERETQRKTRLWEEVERMWGQSAELFLVVSEKRLQGRKIRARAERLFREAEERKRNSKKLREDADQQSAQQAGHRKRIQELLRDARERFGCAAGEEFLYWRQRENKDGAYCVPLISDAENYNVEVRRLVPYRLQRQRGVEFLEPMLMEVPASAVGRVDEFLTTGRRGLKRPDGG